MLKYLHAVCLKLRPNGAVSASSMVACLQEETRMLQPRLILSLCLGISKSRVLVGPALVILSNTAAAWKLQILIKGLIAR